MLAKPLYGLRLKPVAILAGLALIAWVVVMAPAPASASTPSIAQAAPLEGVALGGTAFTDQLQVTGATGTVTFLQATGSDNVTVSPSGQVTVASTVQPGTYAASGTDSDTSGDSGTWSYTVNVLQPAPDGFSNTVDNIYQSEYSVAQQLGQSSTVEPVSQYTQAVSQLSPTQLAILYSAAQHNPEWVQIPSLMQTVASALPGSGLTTTATTISTEKAALSVAKPRTSLSTTGSSPTSAKKAGATKAGSTVVLNDTNSSATPVQPFSPQDCSSDPNIPDAAIFAIEIVNDVAYGTYNFVTIEATVFDVPPVSLIFLAIAEVASVVVLVSQITEDTLNYEALPASECDANNQDGYLANIDNTTTQTYALLASLAGTLTSIQSTVNTTQTDVQNVEAQLTDLKNTFLTTIASDTQTMQATVGSDTQAVTSQLETDLKALQTDVTDIQTDQNTLSQTVTNDVNAGTSQVQSALSTDLKQTLSEIDNQAGSLSTLVTGDNQQVMNTLQANFTTQQNEYHSNLKISIEKALAQWGSVVPPVQYVLPASQGGYLNSTPVGVQEVVTDDMNALGADGLKASPAALKYLQQANAALAAGQYTTAYTDYASCYEAFA